MTSPTAVARDHGGSSVTGVAVPRGPSNSHIVVVPPPYYGWGAWSPWYGYGSGWGYGYGWGFGLGWGYPYAYPYGYGYGPGYGYGSYVGIGWAHSGDGGGGGGYASPVERTGSIRLRVSPSTAQVYIDGALAGTVDEFDGLSNHLELTAGPHQLELRAPGYQTYQAPIMVSADKTLTERATLKKK